MNFRIPQYLDKGLEFKSYSEKGFVSELEKKTENIIVNKNTHSKEFIPISQRAKAGYAPVQKTALPVQITNIDNQFLISSKNLI